MCVRVCGSVDLLSLREHISEITRPIFFPFLLPMHAVRDRAWRHTAPSLLA